METVLAIDAGLSCIKVAAYTAAGELVALAEAPNTAVRTSGPCSDVDLPRLWQLVGQGVREATAKLGDTRVAAVALGGHGNGIYRIGPGGEDLYGITSMDVRAQAVVDAWDRSGVSRDIHRAVGGHTWAGQPLPLLACRGDDAGGTLLFCKDYIRYRLSGRAAVDRGDASAAGLLNLATGDWSAQAFDAAGLPWARKLLPPLVDPWQQAGSVTAEASRHTGLLAGTPVAAGSVDFALGAFGDGLADRATLHVTAGTWAIHQRRMSSPLTHDTILQTITAPWPGEFLMVESSPTCAINLQWLQNLLRPDEAAWRQWDAWLDAPLPPDAPLCLPYPVGAWDMPAQRAHIYNVCPGTGSRELVPAVFEGIVLGHRRQIDKCRRLGEPLQKLVVTGGLTRSGGWCQMLADYTQLEVAVAANPHAACWGAALCALAAAGLTPSAPPPQRRTFAPRRDRRELCDLRYQAFVETLYERSASWT